MKKLFALLLALSLCFALVGCDNESIEVVRIDGWYALTVAEFEDYIIYHAVRINPTYEGFLEIIGFSHKSYVSYKAETLTNTTDPSGLNRAMIKACNPLTKSEILLLFRNREFNYDYKTASNGFLVISERDYPNI